MANVDSPRGFVPIAHISGGQIFTRAYDADEDSDAIYKGDVVTLGLNGKATLAAAGDVVLGVAAESKSTLEGKQILVYDDPNILYEVQGYTGVTFALGMVGEKADIVATAGSSTTNLSLQELNDPEAPTAQFLILGKVDKPDNAWGEHVKLIVKPYETFFGYVTTS
jgi:hypothetical protein